MITGRPTGLVIGRPTVQNAANALRPSLYSPGFGNDGALVPGLWSDTRSSDWNSLDYENVLRVIPAAMLPYKGARVVTNFLPESEDFSDASFNVKTNVTLTHGITDPNGGATATTITATGAAVFGGNDPFGVAGQTNVMSIWVRRRTGTGAVSLVVGDNVTQAITSELTTEWQRFSKYDVLSAATRRRYVVLATSGDEVDIAFLQIEDSTGRTDTTTPSEYQPSAGIAIGSNVVSNGDFSDGTTDGWTAVISTLSVSSGNLRVTSDLNLFGRAYQAISTIPGRLYVAATDYTKGTATGAILRVGTTASGSDLLDASASATGEITGTFTAVGTTTYLSVWNNDNVGTDYSDFDNISVKEASTGTQLYNRTNGNTVNSGVVGSGVGDLFATEPTLVHDPGATNSMADSYDLTTWTQTDISGAAVSALDAVGILGNPATTLTDDDAGYEYVSRFISGGVTASSTNTGAWIVAKDSNVSRFPFFRIQYSGVATKSADAWLNTQTGATTVSGSGAANADSTVVDLGNYWMLLLEHVEVDGNTTCSFQCYPAGGTVFGTASGGATGSCVVAQVDFYKDTTLAQAKHLAPIPTSGGTATRDATAVQHPRVGYVDETVGTHYESLTLRFATGEVTSGSIATINNALGFLYFNAANGYIETTDGTNTATLSTLSWAADEQIEIVLSYSVSGGIILKGRNVTQSGTWVTETTSFDGAFATSGTELDIGLSVSGVYDYA